MKDDYKFSDLLNDLRCGREIEFKYNNNQYSITNSKGYWYIYCDSEKRQMENPCEFADKEMLIKKVSSIQINGLSIENIFNDLKYDTLYVL